MPFGWNPKARMSVKQFPQYLDLVADTRAQFADRVDVRLGLESDYLPGMESWLDELHSSAEFSYILGSVHPQTDEYQLMYLVGSTRLAYEASYFQNLANAAESGSIRLPQPSRYCQDRASLAIQGRRPYGYYPPRSRSHRARRDSDGIKY